MDPQKFALVLAASLLPLLNDKRDRLAPVYRQWETDLALDLKERGMRNPIQVMREGDKFRVLAGETRRRAALAAGIERVPINILDRPLTPAEMLREQLLENEMRMGFSDLERAEMYAEMIAVNNWTQAELARDLKISPGQISKVMSVSSKLPDEVKAMVGSGEGKIGPRAAYQLSRLSDVAEMIQLAQKLAAGALKVESLETIITRKVGMKTKKAKAIKVSLGGMVIILYIEDLPKIFGMMAALDGALKKVEKQGLPVSVLPALLKGA